MTQQIAAQIAPRPLKAYGMLLTLIFAAATGPIVIRQAQLVGIPSLYMITARLLLTSFIIGPLALKRYGAEMRQLRPRDWLFIIASSFSFALNLLFLFFSLEYTSVLVSSVMRRTSPLWVIWLEIIFLGAVFTRYVWLGLGLTVLGSVFVALGAGGAIGAGSNPLLGTTLALIGSVSIGFYLLIGRKFSQSLPSLVYSWLVFTGAGLITLIGAILTGTPLSGYGLKGYMWVVIVTFITQFLGHIPLNMSLYYFQATHISVIMQVSVVASALMALILFNEIPSSTQILGSVAIIAGVMLVSWK